MPKRSSEKALLTSHQNLAPHLAKVLQALSKQESITQIAQQEQVSRKFLYQQKAIAEGALNQAFEKKERENEVLYYLPVTQQWLFQLILALILICHCSYRGVVELLRVLSQKLQKDRINLGLSNFKELQSQRGTRANFFCPKTSFLPTPST